MTWQFLSANLGQGALIHRIQDDMESLYYVVLYCSLLYLPHALSPARLIYIMTQMFDWRNEFDENLRVGGSGKLADVWYGFYTKSIPWGCPAVSTWMSGVRERIEDHYAQSKTMPGCMGLWSPDAFAAFWDTFFDTPPGCDLPDDDRRDHVQYYRAMFSKITPRHATGKPNQATVSTVTLRPDPYRDPVNPAGQVTSLPPNTAPPVQVADPSSGLSAGAPTGARSMETQLSLPISLSSAEPGTPRPGPSSRSLRERTQAGSANEDVDPSDLESIGDSPSPPRPGTPQDVRAGKRKARRVQSASPKKSKRANPAHVPVLTSVTSVGSSNNAEDSRPAGDRNDTSSEAGSGRRSAARRLGNTKSSGRASSKKGTKRS
ncbi:hypothetical protein BV20DRAFT_618198 [Pilatotrama ljubarskyi]|nr:hypothetical protein BV20DRAFT_618198 [Pilatotrama ljubarskyi]